MSQVSVHCPHCGQYTAVSPAPLAVARGDGHRSRLVELEAPSAPVYQSYGTLWWMGKCNACQQPLLVADSGHVILPPPQPGPVHEAIPNPMRRDLLEAKQCIAVGAWNAAVVMARRALQTAAVSLGATKGEQLWKQIKTVAERRLITQQQEQWADAARWVGNHGAHDTEPDIASGMPAITDVNEGDAKDTVDLVEHLFETLYVASHLAESQLAKRNKLPRGS